MMLSPAEPEKKPDAARAPPHSLEQEQALLGALLIDNEAFERVSGFLNPAHFFDPLHARIFETIATLITAGKLASPTTIKTFFENATPVDANTTVPQYLGHLVVNATTTAYARVYAEAIVEMALRRALIVVGEDMAAAAYEAALTVSASDIIEEAETRLFEMAENSETRPTTATFADALRRALNQANTAHKLKGRLNGLSTGLADLDDKLGGLARSDLIVLAGRPSMGKTALATNIAWHIATNGFVDTDGVHKPAPVGFFSLEMSDAQLANRILAAEAATPSNQIARGMLSDDQMENVIRRAAEIANTPLYIEKKVGITIAHLVAMARRMRRRYGVELIVVDYLQLLAGGKRGEGNRVQELTEITTGLKGLAKELDIPVLALSQLSRQVENRTEKRPQLSDLRESGSIEQDADVVMFVYREEYYLERTKPDETDPMAWGDWQKRMAAARGVSEVIIGKQRHGPIGTVRTAFDGALTRFSNLAHQEPGHG